jgi:hypothetical protein
MQAAGIVGGNPSRMPRIARLAAVIVAALLVLGYVHQTSRPAASTRLDATMHAVESVPHASTQPFDLDDVRMPVADWPEPVGGWPGTP